MRRMSLVIVAAALSFGAVENVSAQDILHAMYSRVPVVNWTGFYVGGNFGYGWTNVESSANSVLGSAASSFKMKGVIAGGQLGMNVQFSGPWLIGIESDFQKSWQKLNGPGNTAVLNRSVGVGGLAINETDDMDWFGTTRFRMGVAQDRVLFYGTAGVAYASIRTRASSAGISIINGTPVKIGWAAGGGIEAMLTRNWTVKAEYLYLDFGGYTDPYIYTGTVPGTPVDLHQRITDQIVRFGVNYYFR